MRARTDRAHHPSPARRAARGVVVAAFGAAALVGCGSSAGDGEAAQLSSSQSAALCDAVDQYVTASKAGDRTRMAGALAESLSDLPEEAERDVSAYVDALRTGAPNEVGDGDGVNSGSTEAAFRTLVQEECGDVDLPAEADATTTTEAPIVEGGGGTTDDTSVDGGGTGGDAGAGGSGDAGMGG